MTLSSLFSGVLLWPNIVVCIQSTFKQMLQRMLVSKFVLRSTTSYQINNNKNTTVGKWIYLAFKQSCGQTTVVFWIQWLSNLFL